MGRPGFFIPERSRRERTPPPPSIKMLRASLSHGLSPECAHSTRTMENKKNANGGKKRESEKTKGKGAGSKAYLRGAATRQAVTKRHKAPTNHLSAASTFLSQS